MANCWSIGIFLIIFLGSLCLWNCFNRNNDIDNTNWYGCRDQAGNPTDFFILYKLPLDHHHTLPLIQGGVAYLTLTPDSAKRFQSGGVSSVLSYSDSASEWLFSNFSISDIKSVPGRTLKRLYYDEDFNNVAAYIMYNDEFPDGSKTFTQGHTKGVIVLSEHGGFWLIHSVPRYPPNPSNDYSYPATGHRYGQSMLCISLPSISKQLAQNIGEQLMQNDIDIYAWNLPNSFSNNYPILKYIIDGNRSKEPPYTRVTEIPSAYGKSFTSFAKYKKFDSDLYSDLVAPFLQTDLLVESWRNGPKPLPSICNSTFKVENVESIDVKLISTVFNTHHDHSKWAIAANSDKPVVCVGDINRMETQFKRGGGTVCIESLSIWYRFKNLIQAIETCPKIEQEDKKIHSVIV